MIYYINVNKKRIVGRNNQISTRPLNLEYDVTEELEFQFITDQNQIVDIANLSGMTLAIGLKQNMPSYDLLALSHDYTIEDNTLKFTVNTYTVNWLKKINKPNTEVFIEISQQSLESKKVWMRDYCYVWPRVYTAGLEPEEIASNDYYTKTETDEAIENAIEGIGLSGYVTDEEFEEGLSTKQNTITDENKLGFTLLSGVPNYVSGLTLNGNPVEVVDGVVGIPRTSQNDWGVVRVNPGVGIGADSGQIYTIRAENAEIAARTQNFKPIVPSNLNEAVKAALTDANHVTLTDAEKTTAQTVLGVDAAVSGKQDKITNENKLDYGLVSGAPTVPTSTSQLTNDSGFVTSSVMEDALSDKQDLITEDDWLPGSYVRMDLDPWQGDPEFTVENAVNMVHVDALTALSGVDAVSGALNGKQDAITNDNKLDYALLSGTPSIPLSTSELVNDSDFATSGYVNTQVTAATSGKLDKADYVAPYRLPYNAAGNGWLEEDIGVTLQWSDQDIIPNDRKIVTVTYTNNGDDHLVFPTLIAHANENVIKTCEVWVKMAGDTTEAQGIAAIVVPSSYYIVDESNFPTKLKGEATNSEAYTYHIFVIRTVPRQGASLCEVGYSHFINTNLSI